MEVAGKRLETSPALCEPCKTEHFSKQADGFCTDCNEYMCQTCFLHHLKAKACRNHVLDPFNAGFSDSKLQTREEKCKKHQAETIKYYCHNHDSVACGDCLVLDHPKCEPTFIRDVAKTYEESSEFKSLVDMMQSWEADKAQCETRVKLNREQNKALVDNALQELQSSRRKIFDWLDQKENSIKTQIRAMSDDNDVFLLEMEKKINAVRENVDKIKEKMDTNLYHSENLFIHMVESKERLRFIDATLSDIKTSNDINAFTYKPDVKSNEISELSFKLGSIKFSNEMGAGEKHKIEDISSTTHDCQTHEIQRLNDLPIVQLTEMEVATKSVKILKKLCNARFGVVHAGRLNKRVDVAVKILNHREMTDEAFLAEAKILKQLRHNNIVQLLAVCTLSKPTMIITELMVNGNLLHFLHTYGGKRLKLTQLTAIAGQIADGMAYLETRNCIHRYLRALSILVGKDNQVKVASFGMAQLTERGVYVSDEDKDKFALKWTAPEAAKDGKFSIKSDVWSYGVLLYELITFGKEPYPGMNGHEVLNRVDEGFIMLKPKGGPVSCPEPYYEIMLKCWNRVAESRPTFEYLQDFFENYDVAAGEI